MVGQVLKRRRRAEQQGRRGKGEEPEHRRRQRDRAPSRGGVGHLASDFGERSPLAAEETSSLTMYSGLRFTSS